MGRATGVGIHLLAVLCMIMLMAGVAGAVDYTDTPGTIGYAAARPDGARVSLAMVTIGQVNASGVSVHEWWDKTETVAVLFDPPAGLVTGRTIDVEGLIVTLSSGARAILCDRIAYYLDSNGSVIDSVPPIKGTLEPTVWPSKTWISVSPARFGVGGLSLDGGITALDTIDPPGGGGGSSGGTISPPSGSIAEAKGFADGTSVSLVGKIVTVGSSRFADCIYVEEPNRSCGIRVAAGGGTLVPGDRVDISGGTMGTSPSGERVITGAAVTKTDHPGELAAVGLINRDIGGIALAKEQTVFQQGVLGGRGLNNIGLLVKTVGKLTHNGGTFIYIDDGSNLSDGSGFTGVRVETDHLAAGNPIVLPSEAGAPVSITGISSCMTLNGQLARVLRPRTQGDIVEPSTPTTRPQIPQGESETFDADVPGDAPQGSQAWEIILAGNQVATSGQPDEWLVVFSSLQKFTVGVPEDAEVAADYQVRYIEGSTTASALFDVVPASDNPKVPQGGTANFASGGQEAPGEGLTWDIIRDENVVATDANSHSWVVTCDEENQFTVTAPSSARIAQNYHLRYRKEAATISSLFDVIANNAGIPAPDVPAPAWAAAVIPMDFSPAGGFGPSSADSVNLASGVGENCPDPDLVVNNPTGPDAAFSRLYRSSLAEAGYASPGLSAGWTHSYDITIRSLEPGTLSNLELRYPNGAVEVLTPGPLGGVPPGQFAVPEGAPYVVSGVSLGNGLWESIELKYADQTRWIFRPGSTSPDRYLLSEISALEGNPIHMLYDAAGRLQSITDGTTPTPGALLSLSYDTNGHLSQITDIYARTVSFDFSSAAQTTCLTEVSQLGSGSPRWTYDYTAINGHPYLTSVGAPDPIDGSSIRKRSINYDNNGHVSTLVDANGNRRQFRYNGDRAMVQSIGKTGRPDATWVQKNSALNVDAGTVDAKGKSNSNVFAGYRPTSITNKSGQAMSVTYKPGYPSLVETVTSRLGTVTTYRYGDLSFPMLVTSVKEGSKTSTTFVYDTMGRLARVNSPRPGTVGSTSRVSTFYTYTALGNVETVTEPAPATSGVVTTKNFYTEDAEYGVTVDEALGQPLVVRVYDGLPSDDRVLHEIHYRYDERGNTTAIIDAYGHRTDLEYNIADQPIRTTYPATGGTGRARVECDYLYPGGPLQTTRYYDEGSNLVRTVGVDNGREGEMSGQHGGLQQANYTYDSEYRITSMADGNQHPTTYVYDSVGNLESMANPLGDGTRWSYDADGNVLQRIDGKNQVISYARHSWDSSLVRSIRYPDGNDVGFEYDSYGRVYDMWDDVLGYIEYDYDDNDALRSSTTCYQGWLPLTISYAYYPDGRRKTMTVPTRTGGTMAFTYNYRYDTTYGPGSVMEVTNSRLTAAPIKGYFNQNGQLIRQTSSLTNTSYAYNPRGFLSELRNSSGSPFNAVSEFTGMTYDVLGNRTFVNINVPASGYRLHASGMISYEYADHDSRRLTRERSVRPNYNGTYDHSFSSDEADNLTAIRGIAYAYDADNRLVGFPYDGNGNMLGSPLEYTVGYDYENRPVACYVQDSGKSMAAAFWPNGMRGWKNVDGYGNRYFLYDGDTLVCEMDDEGPLYIYGHGPAGLVQRLDLADESWGDGWIFDRQYMFDPQGTVVQRLDTDWSSVDTLVYDAYGALRNTSTSSDRMDPVGFLGQWGAYTDWELGTYYTYPIEPAPLVLAQVRYYDPKLARFTSRDPSADGMNWYAYAENNPVRFVDPKGTSSFGADQWESCRASAVWAYDWASYVFDEYVKADPSDPFAFLGPAGEGISAAAPIIEHLGSKALGKAAKLISRETSLIIPESLCEGGLTNVYIGFKNGVASYVGITSRPLSVREAEHGGQYVLQLLTPEPLSRRAARSIEQVIIMQNRNFANKIGSVSPKNVWYEDGLKFGSQYLQNLHTSMPIK